MEGIAVVNVTASLVGIFFFFLSNDTHNRQLSLLFYLPGFADEARIQTMQGKVEAEVMSHHVSKMLIVLAKETKPAVFLFFLHFSLEHRLI